MPNSLFFSRALIPFLFVALPVSASASSAGTSVFSFLKITPQAAVSAMGDVMVSPSAQSACGNPAILPWVGHAAFTASHMQYLADISYSNLHYLHPIDMDTTIAGSVAYLGVPGIPRTVADASVAGYAEQGTFSAHDAAASVSYGRRVSRDFSFGATLRGVEESLDTSVKSSGIMVSLGGYYRHPWDEWQAGFGVVNAGPSVKGYQLPTGVFAGIGQNMYPHFFWAGEVMGYTDGIIDIRTGLEYEFRDTLYLRGGYRFPLKEYNLGDFPFVNLTAGVGLKLGDVGVDYAWVPYGDLGMTHRLSLSWAIGPDMIRKQNAPLRGRKRT